MYRNRTLHRAAPRGGPSPEPESPYRLETERRLVALMFGRLLLTLLSLGIVLALDRAGLVEPLGEAVRHGIYWTLAFGFFATALSGLWLRRLRRPVRFAAVQFGIDLGVVSLLVHLSGGHESVFTFLYIAVTAGGAVLFAPRSVFAGASASAVAYGAVLLLEQLGLGSDFDGSREIVHGAVALGTWAIHVGALFLVAALGSLVTRELRRAGAQLDRSSDVNRQLRDLNSHIVQSLNSGLLTTDREGRIGSFNPQAERIAGSKAGEVLGRAVEDVIPGTWDLLCRSEEEGLAPLPRNRLPYESPDGVAMFLGLAGTVLRDGNGDPVGHLLIFQDVTGIVEMETRLTQRERLAAVGEMAARIAHEVRNPLAAISGSVQLLREAPGAGAAGDGDQLMDIVVREADRLGTLVGDFLGYARPESRVREPVALYELASEVLTVLRGTAGEGIDLELAGHPDAALLGDSAQLRQVIWNLCLNGIEAMPKGGRLRVSVERAPQAARGPGRREEEESPRDGLACGRICTDLVVTVEDEGQGIDPQWLDRLFEPFFTTKAGGTGLGLATVHRIVEANGGQVEVETEPGRGTRFRCRLESRTRDE